MIYPQHPPCQLHDILWKRSAANRARHLFRNFRAKLGFRLRHQLARKPRQKGRLGAPSAFGAGDWVRVLDEDRVRETLDDQDRLRGLAWMQQQWSYCGTMHRVLKPVRRMMDDDSVMRAISRTVLIDTVPCGGATGITGCGRECPMMFRDEWIEKVAEPTDRDDRPALGSAPVAEVRSADEISGTLDSNGRCNGILFMPEMYGYANQRFPILKKIERVWGPGVYVPAAEPVYLLDGLFCSGEVLGDIGPCERACRVVWHERWIRLIAAERPSDT